MKLGCKVERDWCNIEMKKWSKNVANKLEERGRDTHREREREVEVEVYQKYQSSYKQEVREIRK